MALQCPPVWDPRSLLLDRVEQGRGLVHGNKSGEEAPPFAGDPHPPVTPTRRALLATSRGPAPLRRFLGTLPCGRTSVKSKSSWDLDTELMVQWSPAAKGRGTRGLSGPVVPERPLLGNSWDVVPGHGRCGLTLPSLPELLLR